MKFFFVIIVILFISKMRMNEYFKQGKLVFLLRFYGGIYKKGEQGGRSKGRRGYKILFLCIVGFFEDWFYFLFF